MTAPFSSPEALRQALTTPTQGILGLVDDLLRASCKHGIRLDWKADHCRVWFGGGGQQDWIEVPLRKSVVRAALARVAVLCNQRKPNSVSPYGGQGELLVGADPATALRVAFVNTTQEQSLELTPLRDKSTPVPPEAGVDGRPHESGYTGEQVGSNISPQP
jgi:hypothetical protein